MLSVIMQSVVMLSVIVLKVVAPNFEPLPHFHSGHKRLKLKLQKLKNIKNFGLDKFYSKKFPFLQIVFETIHKMSVHSMLKPGNTKGWKYHCTVDLLFDWF
jgi:hypothetical protein